MQMQGLVCSEFALVLVQAEPGIENTRACTNQGRESEHVSVYKQHEASCSSIWADVPVTLAVTCM